MPRSSRRCCGATPMPPSTALAKHFNVTMRFVEQNAPEIAEVSHFRK